MTGNRKAGREPAPAGRELAPAEPARRPSITSPAELAAHLGRELSATAVDGNGWTDQHYAAALHWAAMGDAAAAAAVLLNHGADIHARADGGSTPLRGADVYATDGARSPAGLRGGHRRPVG